MVFTSSHQNMKQLTSLLVLLFALRGCLSRAQNLPLHDDDVCPPGTHWSDGRCKPSVRVRFGHQEPPALLSTSSSPSFVTPARPLLQSVANHPLDKDKCLPGYKPNKQGVCKPSYLHPLQWLLRLHPFYGSNLLNQCSHGLPHNPHFAYLPFLYNALLWGKGINSLPHASRYWGYLNYGSLFPYKYHGLSACPPGFQIYRGKCHPTDYLSLLAHHII